LTVTPVSIAAMTSLIVYQLVTSLFCRAVCFISGMSGWC